MEWDPELSVAPSQTDDRAGSPGIAFVAGDVELSPHEVEIVGLDIVGASLLDGTSSLLAGA